MLHNFVMLYVYIYMFLEALQLLSQWFTHLRCTDSRLDSTNDLIESMVYQWLICQCMVIRLNLFKLTGLIQLKLSHFNFLSYPIIPTFYLLCYKTRWPCWGRGGGTQLFLGGCVPRGFQNVGSRERIFLENWGSWERKLEKFGSRELEFWPKQGWKFKNFIKIEKGGHKSGTLTVNWWARERQLAWKGRSWLRHIPIPLSNVSRFPGCWGWHKNKRITPFNLPIQKLWHLTITHYDIILNIITLYLSLVNKEANKVVNRQGQTAKTITHPSGHSNMIL